MIFSIIFSEKDHLMEYPGRITSTLIAIAAMIVFLAAQPGLALVVSEVMYHPVEAGANEDGDENLEFIELYNDKAVFEDLGQCAFTDGIEYTFPAGTKLQAAEYIVIARNPQAVEAEYGITGVYGPWGGKLDNDGERIDLSNEVGGIILSFAYNDGPPWPQAADGAGHSLVLSKLAGDPEETSTWAQSLLIGGSPGRADALDSGSEDPTSVTLIDLGHPGRYFKGVEEPSPASDGSATTEWTGIEFDDDPTRTDWIEGASGYGYSNESSELAYVRTVLNDMRYNYSSVYARLSFELTQKQIASFSQLQADVRYDDGFVLYLNGRRLGDSGNFGGANPPVYNATTSEGAGENARMVLDLTSDRDLLVPGTNVLSVQLHNVSRDYSSDCYVLPVLRAVVEPVSVSDPDACLKINEILANSDAPPGTDWVEIYNPGPVAVDLSTIYLSDDRLDLLDFQVADSGVLQPGQFYTVRQGATADSFPFGLSFEGETVYLTMTDGGTSPQAMRVLDAVRYDVCPPDVTYGRYPDGADRMSLLSSATFSSANEIPLINDIVINEIMYHHGSRDERYEYVELYNKGATAVSLSGWKFTDGIEYEFPPGTVVESDAYVVVAENPGLLQNVYPGLVDEVNLFGPYSGRLNDHSERIELSYPIYDVNDSGQLETFMVTADAVTYYDGGRWPKWADGEGSSMELRDPDNENDSPDAWADSDESGKSQWKEYSFSISGADSRYTHDNPNVFGMMLLNRGEVLIDDVELQIEGQNKLANNGFEDGQSGWRFLGNHVRSFVTTEDPYDGARCLHLVATGHGDPGANRINRYFNPDSGDITFKFRARWLRGSRYMLLRTSRERSPVQPPRPARSFELDMPYNQGTPGARNTAYISNRGPDIAQVRHDPVLPASGQSIVVTARVSDYDDVSQVVLHYRSEGSGSFATETMVDNGSGNDELAGDGVYTGVIPGAGGGTMRAFYIVASDGQATTRFPTKLEPSAQFPDRTCLVRIGDSRLNTRFATYRVWAGNDVLNAFNSRPNLSNELMDCTFVYNDSEVFYNTGIRFRGSPFLRSGFGRSLTGRYAYRVEFNPDQRFRRRDEINLDNTENYSRGALQERASYWFYRKMGLQYSRQEYVRLIINGSSDTSRDVYEDVQKIDGDYIEAWFGEHDEGYIHKIDDYFEYTADGREDRNLDEGLKYDAEHPALKETYRWGFEKRSHRETDRWDHLVAFAQAMNTPSGSSGYESTIESYLHPDHFAAVLAIRHALGDWDSYGFDRGKNNYFYYALPEGKWYLLPWDIDFTLGSGRSAHHSLFSISEGDFPEVAQFLRHAKYERKYLQVFAELVYGPWRTSYGTGNPPTEFDLFLDDASNALVADGDPDGRRNGIKQYVRDRRNFILQQIPPLSFEITSNGGEDVCTSAQTFTIRGIASVGVAQVLLNGEIVPSVLSGSTFEVDVDLEMGANRFDMAGLGSTGEQIPGMTDSITITRVPATDITSITPNRVSNDGMASLTIKGSGFTPGSNTDISLGLASEETGFDALYVASDQGFDRIDAASLLLDEPQASVLDSLSTVYPYVNLGSARAQGEFLRGEYPFDPEYLSSAENFAVRFRGYIYAPSPGVRYFGVNSDDGFVLSINNELVGEYGDIREEATTDVTHPGTAGTMSYDFPESGLYHVVLDFFVNDSGAGVEFFQTDQHGHNPRIVNDGSELTVFRDNLAQIHATNVVVVDENTITCDVDVSGAKPAAWDVVLTPECGPLAGCKVTEGLTIIGFVADMNLDSKVNFRDVAVLENYWHAPCSAPDWCNGADLNESGRVDMADIEILTREWLATAD